MRCPNCGFLVAGGGGAGWDGRGGEARSFGGTVTICAGGLGAAGGNSGAGGNGGFSKSYTYPAEVLFTLVAQQVPHLWPDEPSRSPEDFAQWIVQKLLAARMAEGK